MHVVSEVFHGRVVPLTTVPGPYCWAVFQLLFALKSVQLGKREVVPVESVAAYFAQLINLALTAALVVASVNAKRLPSKYTVGGLDAIVVADACHVLYEAGTAPPVAGT